MASINSVSGTSSSNSIYGSRNVISGLASGMDTEAMIENAVSGIKARITALGQKRTKVEWQQEAYRSIISKMVGFSDKYSSYTSSTNLSSPSFFNNAVVTTANGANKDLVSATGRTSNDVSILGVKQLATAARYTIGATGLSGPDDLILGEAFTWGERDFSAIDGTMTLKYGTKNALSLNFSELDVYDSADKLAEAIEEKLADQTITFSNGKSKKASECIGVEVVNGRISFTDKTGGGQEVSIGSMTGNFKEVFGGQEDGHVLAVDPDTLTKKQTTAKYLSGKSMTFTLDGVTKTVKFDDLLTGADTTLDAFKGNLQTKLNQVFGPNKIAVAGDDVNGLSFQVRNEGSSLKISSEANQVLGLGKGDATTYLNTGKTLKDLKGDLTALLGEPTAIMGKGDPIAVKENGEVSYYIDQEGNTVNENGERLDEDGNVMKGYAFKMNGVVIGHYTEDTALETIMLDINNNTEAGVKVNYSKTSNEFVFTAKETGSGGRVSFDGDDGSALSRALFGADITGLSSITENGQTTWYETGTDGNPDLGKKVASSSAGQDAVFTASVNGTEMQLTRSSNLADLDGLKVTLNGVFGDYSGPGDTLVAGSTEAVTFTTKSDADKIVEAVKTMVEDYNAMVTEIKEAYSTQPAQKSNKTRYEPLTDEDMADMSESAIKAYEEKAKQGILFADSDLSSLYDKLRSAVTSTGNDGAYLRSIGITTAYNGGLTTLDFDEGKLRAALESDPDKVKDAFTKSKDNGSATNGLMADLKITLDNYANKTGATKGILIEKAGSPLAPTSILENDLKNILDNYDKQIDSWELKLSDQIDRYTTKFSRLEQLIAQMNSQSSMLSGLMQTGY